MNLPFSSITDNTANQEAYFDAIERDLITQIGADQDAIRDQAQRAAARWACISAKSHRSEKNPLLVYAVELFDNQAEIKPIFETVQGSVPPSREDSPIHHFSKKSKNRLLQKYRKMRKDGLPLPLFVTLTYQKNYTDCRGAKKHLDNFFKRYRRATNGRLKYVWKMEFQKRGAVHFHCAIWLPDEFTNELKNNQETDPNKRLLPLRTRISRDWAEVTADVDGFPARYSAVEYYRKKDGSYSVYNRGEREYNCPSAWHEKYGTNVREVENQKMAVGYLGKYFSKIVQKTEADQYTETGRFWGFSNNFCFDAIHSYATDISELNQLNDVAAGLNNEFWYQYKQQQIGNWQRAKEKFAGNPEKLENQRTKIKMQMEKQARRYAINHEKIKLGYRIQFEILSETANDIVHKNMKPIPAGVYFRARSDIHNLF